MELAQAVGRAECGTSQAWLSLPRNIEEAGDVSQLVAGPGNGRT